MKFLVLQHINIEHPGIFLKFMKEDNIKIDTVELDENEKIPNLDPYDAMIVMGGPMDTWQEETFPWLKPEKEAIHKIATINKKPYLEKTFYYSILIYLTFILSTKNEGKFLAIFLFGSISLVFGTLFTKAINPDIYNDFNSQYFMLVSEAWLLGLAGPMLKHRRVCVAWHGYIVVEPQ